MSLLDIDDTLQQQMGNLDLNKQVRYVIVPVSTIGCGKTTVFQTLAQLFPKWIHIQNDNIGKSSKTKIVDHAIKALATHEVVLFDRNNSSYKERKQIFDDFETKLGKLNNNNYQIEFICVNFVKDIDSDDLWEITKGRVFARGDNHQTIKSNTDPDTAIMVMQSFMKRFQPVDSKQAPDEEFDFIINLELGESSSLTNTKIIINALSEKYPNLIKDQVPSDETISRAFAESLKYTPTYTKIMPKMKKITYFGISINKETVVKMLQEALENNQDWKLLQHMNRVQAEFHVTVGHVASKSKEAKAKWNKLAKRFPAKYEDKDRTMLGFYCDVKMTDIVVRTDKLICVKVDILDVYDSNFEVTDKIELINKYPHVTIGTFSNKTKPSESNTVLESIFKNKSVSNEVFPIEKVLEKQQMFANF
jgi:tRNA ligase